MENVLEVKNLNKKYNTFKLKNITFDVKEGKIVGLIGANGSGKTTTIKSILNLIKIDKGEISIFGKDYKTLGRLDKENIGVILDDSFLPMQLDVMDINIIMKNLFSKWDSRKYFKYIKRFELPKSETIKNFSSGMKMKLKIACALSHDVKLLILDEPTNGLDPVFRYDFLNLLSDLVKDKNVTVLMSSHITSDLEHVADEIIFIKNGEIILNENKKKLFEENIIAQIEHDLFDKISKDDYVKYLEYKDDYLLLVKDKKFFKKYPKAKRLGENLEDIMLLYIKGEENE